MPRSPSPTAAWCRYPSAIAVIGWVFFCSQSSVLVFGQRSIPNPCPHGYFCSTSTSYEVNWRCPSFASKNCCANALYLVWACFCNVRLVAARLFLPARTYLPDCLRCFVKGCRMSSPSWEKLIPILCVLLSGDGIPGNSQWLPCPVLQLRPTPGATT